MEFVNKFNYKSISLFMVLLIIPNILGMININLLGFKIHFFQYAIFLAAMIYGPIGGLASGLIGSVYSSILMNNPYILLFNALLGLLVGLFFRRFNIYTSVLLAFIIQVPVIYFIDLLLVGLPNKLIISILTALMISNMIWATIAKYTHVHTKNVFS